MAIENFVKRWTIRNTTTDLIAVDDQLHIERVGNSPKVEFRCDSPNSGTSKSWGDVKNCKWSKHGGPAGHLAGTIADADGDSYPLAFTYAKGANGEHDRIHLEVVAMPKGGGGVVALGGGSGGGAGGDDGPPQ